MNPYLMCNCNELYENIYEKVVLKFNLLYLFYFGFGFFISSFYCSSKYNDNRRISEVLNFWMKCQFWQVQDSLEFWYLVLPLKEEFAKNKLIGAKNFRMSYL